MVAEELFLCHQAIAVNLAMTWIPNHRKENLFGLRHPVVPPMEAQPRHFSGQNWDLHWMAQLHLREGDHTNFQEGKF